MFVLSFNNSDIFNLTNTIMTVSKTSTNALCNRLAFLNLEYINVHKAWNYQFNDYLERNLDGVTPSEFNKEEKKLFAPVLKCFYKQTEIIRELACRGIVPHSAIK